MLDLAGLSSSSGAQEEFKKLSDVLQKELTLQMGRYVRDAACIERIAHELRPDLCRRMQAKSEGPLIALNICYRSRPSLLPMWT